MASVAPDPDTNLISNLIPNLIQVDSGSGWYFNNQAPSLNQVPNLNQVPSLISG